MVNKKEKRIKEALSVLIDLGLPRPQQNDRSALCLLALLNLTPKKMWSEAESQLIGITPIMDWVSTHYGRQYAPNSRETFRRFTMHQFVQGGLALYNPDRPDRPVNSPKAVYQIEPNCLKVIRTFGTKNYGKKLKKLLTKLETLSARYAKHRKMEMVPIKIAEESDIQLSPGDHSELIREIWEKFGPRFVPGGLLVYAGDTGDKWGYFDEKLLLSLGVKIDNHGKMPDVIIYYSKRNWLIIAEAVTSHGPVDAKRHEELMDLFKSSKAGLVFVSAFPDRRYFARYQEAISWETEVWIAESPSHLIHFNGAKFLGPYND